ncbi:hypothetical protein Agub_g11061, partial [Astrephomene gubernaculifera]
DSSGSGGGRYRLRLRPADDAFFRANVLDAFLPVQYRLEGAAAAAAASAGPATATAAWVGFQPLRQQEQQQPGGLELQQQREEEEGGKGEGGEEEAEDVAERSCLPLANETWWRLYDNAAFLRDHLTQLAEQGVQSQSQPQPQSQSQPPQHQHQRGGAVGGSGTSGVGAGVGLNLQDFAFHVLRNCFVVLMVARDESASFRIFSTLNGRGMDLSVVDKLKADL